MLQIEVPDMTESDDVKVTFFRKKNQTGIVRKPRVLRKAVDLTRTGGRAVTTPYSSAKAIEVPFGAISRLERTSPPIEEKKTIRKPRRSVPVVFAQKEAYKTEEPREMEVRKQARPMLREKGEVQDTPDFLDAAPTICEERKISMKALHQFAKNRLPKESILREIILMEKGELTPQQFLDRVEIWLRLFDRES